MSLKEFIAHYGYIAVLIGTFLEGETILVLAGVAAKIGYLKLFGVILAAFFGTFGGDQLFFFMGRYKGQKIMARRPQWQYKAKKVNTWVKDHQNLVMLGFRFLYGFRTITPFIIGMSEIKTRKFFVFNFLGALLWSFVIASAGYVFGHAAEYIFKDIQRYELEIFAGVAIVGGVVWLWRIFNRNANHL
jgi:membrane protein DedA with SNARE-associated domain